VIFLLAVPARAVFFPILKVVSAMGFDGRTTQVNFAVAIALTIVIAGVLFFQLNRLAMLDRRRNTLANAWLLSLVFPFVWEPRTIEPKACSNHSKLLRRWGLVARDLRGSGSCD
jgi:hypothetical protein